MPLTGTFSTMPFVDLLQWLGDARRSGTLSVTLEFEERYLRFLEGKIAAYGSDDPMARDLGRLCLSRGLCAEEQLLAALSKQAQSHMPLGDVLVAEGAVTAERLEETVRGHVEETVLGLFLWPEGRFAFSEALLAPFAEGLMPPEYELSEPLDTRGILMEGMRRLDEWNRIVRGLPSDEARLVVLGPAADLPILEEIAAHPDPPSIGQLLAWKGDNRYAVCEQLFRAVERGLLAFEAGAPSEIRATTAQGSTTVEHLVRAAESMIAEGQHDEAASLLRSALSIDPYRPEVRALLRRSHEAQLLQLYDVMPRDVVPQVSMASAAISRLQLGHRDRRMLEHVNGRWDVQALAITTSLGELEALRALRRLIHAGVVTLG
jgi:hypothetical protein